MNPIRVNTDGIRIHTSEEFDRMRKSCILAAKTLDMIGKYVVPGVSTNELDRICHDFIVTNNAVPATLGYRGFPKSSCISINHVVCHGIPSDRLLKEGDILNIDVTCILDGWYGDTSRMYVAGKLNRKAARLIDVTHESLIKGISVVKPSSISATSTSSLDLTTVEWEAFYFKLSDIWEEQIGANPLTGDSVWSVNQSKVWCPINEFRREPLIFKDFTLIIYN